MVVGDDGGSSRAAAASSSVAAAAIAVAGAGDAFVGDAAAAWLRCCGGDAGNKCWLRADSGSAAGPFDYDAATVGEGRCAPAGAIAAAWAAAAMAVAPRPELRLAAPLGAAGPATSKCGSSEASHHHNQQLGQPGMHAGACWWGNAASKRSGQEGCGLILVEEAWGDEEGDGRCWEEAPDKHAGGGRRCGLLGSRLPPALSPAAATIELLSVTGGPSLCLLERTDAASAFQLRRVLAGEAGAQQPAAVPLQGGASSPQAACGGMASAAVGGEPEPQASGRAKAGADPLGALLPELSSVEWSDVLRDLLGCSRISRGVSGGGAGGCSTVTPAAAAGEAVLLAREGA
ncbi:hypothetical protein HXX76_014358 [Chlamydomonas incerta]|uniref:Uncharacterized protein n=1 Tax=Chlamydomonas incerta TaxID=51695 RepID=A0A835VSX6_CHLIN|nr:hypothetical protein HXX76_014358 [Chlamydomonas incerta]|eukprot:KAG2424633.1 hypothetical protein HXX76_014358 [Chlamydomonas incerta]